MQTVKNIWDFLAAEICYCWCDQCYRLCLLLSRQRNLPDPLFYGIHLVGEACYKVLCLFFVLCC